MRAKSEKAEGEPGQGGPLAHNIPPQARFDTLSAVHDPGYNDLIRRLDESDHVPRPAARRRPAVNPRIFRDRVRGSRGTSQFGLIPARAPGDRFEVSRYTHLT